MINETHFAKITQLINTSQILSDQEKTDWLALLELMNDKQISELESILSMDKAVAASAQPAAAQATQPKPVAKSPAVAPLPKAPQAAMAPAVPEVPQASSTLGSAPVQPATTPKQMPQKPIAPKPIAKPQPAPMQPKPAPVQQAAPPQPKQSIAQGPIGAQSATAKPAGAKLAPKKWVPKPVEEPAPITGESLSESLDLKKTPSAAEVADMLEKAQHDGKLDTSSGLKSRPASVTKLSSQQTKEAVPAKATASQTDLGQVTPLGHISNLPSQFSVNDPNKKPDQPPATFEPEQTPKQGTETAAVPDSTPEASTKAPKKSTEELPAIVLKNIGDVKSINASIFAQGQYDQVVHVLQQMVQYYGYLKVVSEFEKSLLYQDYLNYGKALLSSNNYEVTNNLGPDEFALVADMLLKMKTPLKQN